MIHFVVLQLQKHMGRIMFAALFDSLLGVSTISCFVKFIWA